VQLNLVERRRRLEQLAHARPHVVEVREDGVGVHVRLAAKELVATARPAVVDAARLGLRALHKLGHDRRGRRPVLDGERRLDGHEGLLGPHAAHLPRHERDPRIDAPVGGAEAVHAGPALVELRSRAVQLNLVERRRRLEQLAHARPHVVEVREDGVGVHVRLAAKELVATARPAVVEAARLGLRALHKLGHDRRGKGPVLDGERRLDGHEGVSGGAWREQLRDGGEGIGGPLAQDLAHGLRDGFMHLVLREVLFVRLARSAARGGRIGDLVEGHGVSER